MKMFTTSSSTIKRKIPMKKNCFTSSIQLTTQKFLDILCLDIQNQLHLYILKLVHQDLRDHCLLTTRYIVFRYALEATKKIRI